MLTETMIDANSVAVHGPFPSTVRPMKRGDKQKSMINANEGKILHQAWGLLLKADFITLTSEGYRHL